MIYMDILPLPRIHEEQLSAAGEREESVQSIGTLKPQSHIHGFGPGRATVHPDLASR